MIAPAAIARVLAENPGMDELTAYRVARARRDVQRHLPDIRRDAIMNRRGIYK